MIAWWMAQLLILGGLVALAAYGADTAARITRRPTRGIWAGALLLAIGLGVLAPMRVASHAHAALPALPSAASATLAPHNPSQSLFELVRFAWNQATTRVAQWIDTAWDVWHSAMPSWIETALLATWIVASVALLIAFVAVHLRYRRRVARWPQQIVHGIAVRIAENTGPAVIGLARTEIVLPAWLLARDDREHALVIAHESEHVRARDPLLLAVAQFGVVLLPWHPAVWWMASRLRLAVELDCDRRVLQRGATARAYGTVLINLTGHRAGLGAALPAFSCSPSHLERRLIAMTPTPVRFPIVRAASAGAVATLALLAACETKVPTDERASVTAANPQFVERPMAVTLDSAPDSAARVRVGRDNASSPIPDVVAVGIRELRASGGTVEFDTLARDRAPATAGGVRQPKVRLTFPRASATETGAVRVYSREAPISAMSGLLVINGVPRESTALNDIPPTEITSMNVLRGPSATAKYSDPRAANGVIEVVTKRARP
jgi:beta-lactamase regulating signal transducer with metallopeptidase domain